jgi:plastocyanin
MARLGTLILALTVGFISAAPVLADEPVVIEIFQYQYNPKEITIAPGTTVRWVNREKRQFHNVWFKEAGEEPGEYLFPEDEYERVFEKAGDYPYVCQPHEDRGMTGRIIVAE